MIEPRLCAGRTYWVRRQLAYSNPSGIAGSRKARCNPTHEQHEISRGHLGWPHQGGEDERRTCPPAYDRGGPRGRPRGGSRVVAANGRLRRTGAASPTIGAMSQRRLRIERNAGLGLTPVADPAPARYADLETGVKKRSHSGNPELGLSQFGILADIHGGGRARRACKA